MPYGPKLRNVIVGVLMLSVGLVGVSSTPANAEEKSAKFRSPTLNIECYISNFDADRTNGGCIPLTADEKNFPSKPADCDLDWSPSEMGIRSVLTGKKITNTVEAGTCNGGVTEALCLFECPVLQYGKSIKIGRITCSSKKAGMTCVTNKGKRVGFTLNRSGYKIIK